MNLNRISLPEGYVPLIEGEIRIIQTAVIRIPQDEIPIPFFAGKHNLIILDNISEIHDRRAVRAQPEVAEKRIFLPQNKRLCKRGG